MSDKLFRWRVQAAANVAYLTLVLIVTLIISFRFYNSTPPDPEFTFLAKHAIRGAAEGHFNKMLFVFSYAILPVIGIFANAQFVLLAEKIKFIGSSTLVGKVFNKNPLRTIVYFGSAWAFLCTFMPFNEYALFQTMAQLSGGSYK